jgi:hypothetical protein
MTLFDHPVWLDAIERAEDDRRAAFAQAEGSWRRRETERFAIIDRRRQIVEEANALRRGAA